MASAQCRSSTVEHQALPGARAPDQIDDHAAAATVAGTVVHGVVDRPQLRRLRQIQKVVQEHALVRRHQPLRDRTVAGRRPRPDLGARGQAQQTAHDRPDGIAALADAEVQDEPGVTRKALGDGDATEFVDQAALADAGFAAHVHRQTAARLPAGGDDALELAELGAAADERPPAGLGALVAQAEDAPDLQRLIEALDRELAAVLADDHIGVRLV